MSLRGALLPRVSVVAQRLYCNSAPSSSRVLVNLNSTHSVFSSRTISAFVPVAAKRYLGSASFVWVRGGQGKDWEEAEEVKGARTRHADSNSSSSGGERGADGQEPIKPMGPDNQPSKMRLFVIAAVLSFAVTSLIFTTLIAGDAAAEDAIPSDAPVVDFDTFAAKYLKAGEIQKITFVVGKEKAVGTLHAGAVIDGRLAKSGHVVINYPHPPQQFWADVRREEASMGISLQQGVDIQPLNPVSGWRMMEFFLGCFILGWLCTQYGRIAVRKMAEERAKKGGAPK